MQQITHTTRAGMAELIALLAMLFATIAFSVDAMLPALPEIGAELSPLHLERAPLILSAFILGMGIGTFVTGPLSDAYGRRPIIFAGAGVYILAAATAWVSNSLELMLAARLVQGLGAAGPRVVAMAVVRDLFAGREMARISSIILMVFTIVPAIAPALGAVIISLVGWRGIFLAFILFAMLNVLWMGLRLPETLAKEDRRPIKIALLKSAIRQIFAIRLVRLSIAVQSLAMGMLFVTLMLVQQVYEVVYDKAESFPYWFGLVALMSAGASLVNALLVVKYGMRRLVTFALCAQILLSTAFLALDLATGTYGFAFFIFWQTGLFLQTGLTLGNLNALAMEPLGHVAGIAASVISAVSTVTAALITAPIGTMFDGTVRPLIIAILVMSSVGVVLMGMMMKDDKVRA